MLPSSIRTRLGRSAEIGPATWYSSGISNELEQHILRPSIYLAALYHPENFPLPRFSLAISDLIRAARNEGVGVIEARDMQLGATIDQIAGEVKELRPDIIGISATFGQDDVLEALLERISPELSQNSLLAFGGSLSVLNREVLLRRFPYSVVSTGPGEATIAGLVRMLRQECTIEDIPGLAYVKSAGGPICRTPNTSPRDTEEMIPELDLLQATFEARGVIQLESSRGCSYACSFCPRTHKGMWAGDDPIALDAVMPDIKRIQSRFPDITPRIFLVDEEFIGYRANGEAEARALGVARRLAHYGYRFETNSRADQVFRRNRNSEWHESRINLWKELVRTGLERCLFGIESGVDAVLQRFNKKTTSDQNVAAIRILSLIGVPPRYTYITFDPLMSREDLYATYEFQAREDLILTPQDKLESIEIYNIAVDDVAAQSKTSCSPFYKHISYMLVSIECLIDAPYTAAVERFGLLGSLNTTMGRYDSRYLDPDIGIFSDVAQRWIDRHFSLDYLLKSIEKYASGLLWKQTRGVRTLIKQYAFEALGLLIALWDPYDSRLRLSAEQLARVSAYDHATWFASAVEGEKTDIALSLMSRHYTDMRTSMQERFSAISSTLPFFERKRISQELESWAIDNDWRRING